METTKETPELVLPDYSKAIAIIIAIEEYRYANIPKVQYATNDAIEFEKILKENLGVSERSIHKFINQFASKTAIENEVKYLIKTLSESDIFIFYYAGHGFYSLGSNRLTVYDSSVINIYDTTISLKDLVIEPIIESLCSKALMFIDACAEKIVEISRNSRDVISSLSEYELNEFINSTKYNATFFSCSPGEKSHSDDTLQHGIWSHFLFQALSGKDRKSLLEDKYLTDTSLRDYLRMSVPNFITKNTTIKNAQTPYSHINSSNTFGIKLFEKEKKSSILKTIDILIEKPLTIIHLISIPSNKAKGFKNGHHMPSNNKSSSELFIRKVFRENVSDDIQHVYNQTRNVLGLTRDKITKIYNDLDTGSVENSYFKYTIQVFQDEKNLSNGKIKRTLFLKEDHNSLPDNFADIFTVSFKAIYFKISTNSDYDTIVRYFEEVKSIYGGQLVDDDRINKITYSSVNGFILVLLLDQKQLSIHTQTNQTVDSLVKKSEELLSLVLNKAIKLF